MAYGKYDWNRFDTINEVGLCALRDLLPCSATSPLFNCWWLYLECLFATLCHPSAAQSSLSAAVCEHSSVAVSEVPGADLEQQLSALLSSLLGSHLPVAMRCSTLPMQISAFLFPGTIFASHAAAAHSPAEEVTLSTGMLPSIFR